MKEKLIRFLTRYGYIVYAVVFVILYAAILMHEAYFQDFYISHDSANYLREASALRSGYGFNVDGAAGSMKHFAAWPVGYPALIALVSVVFQIGDLYLASKVLSILAVALVIAIAAIRWKERVALCSLFFFNPGVFQLFLYTWSESVFSVLLFCFCVCACDSIRKPDRPVPYVFMFVTSFMAFTVRYFGAVCVVFAGLIFALRVCRLVFRKEKEAKKSAMFSFATCMISGISILLYLEYNRKMCGYGTGIAREEFNESYAVLLKQLVRALGTEFKNLFFLSDTIPFQYLGGAVGTVCLLVITVAAVIAAVRKKRIEALVFLSFAVLYDAMFIVIRFFSTMDIFYYRFFAPVAGCFFTGLILLIGDDTWKKISGADVLRYIPSIAAVFMLFSTGNLAVQHLSVYRTSKYEEEKAEWLKKFEHVPANALYLYAQEDPEYLMLYFRPDVVFFPKTDSCYDSYETEAGWSMTDLHKAYPEYAYFCIARDRLEEVASEEIADVFRSIPQENEILCIPAGYAD